MSREALIGAMIDGATLLDIAGGVLSVVVGRAPTDVPGEMVMTGALLEWKDRTDARAQPEAPVAVTPEPRREPEPKPEDRDRWVNKRTGEELEVKGEPTGDGLVEPEGDIDPSDGFDYSKLEEGDVDEPVRAG